MPPYIRVNFKIRAPQCRCVNADGSMVGVLPTRDALRLAQEQGLDLVEISPNANPPVCRIMDFGKFRYEESVRRKEARKKTHRQALKEIKFHANVGEHDFAYKVNHIKEFLGKGHKVKVSLQFRGRENAHRELGFQVVSRVMKECEGTGTIEMAPRLMGTTIVAMVSPKSGKRHDSGPATGSPQPSSSAPRPAAPAPPPPADSPGESTATPAV